MSNTHSFWSSSISSFFWHPVDGFAMLNWKQRKGHRSDARFPQTPPIDVTARRISLPSWWRCGASSRQARSSSAGHGGGGARARVFWTRGKRENTSSAYIGRARVGGAGAARHCCEDRPWPFIAASRFGRPKTETNASELYTLGPFFLFYFFL